MHNWLTVSAGRLKGGAIRSLMRLTDEHRLMEERGADTVVKQARWSLKPLNKNEKI
jgi:hypothetical protein